MLRNLTEKYGGNTHVSFLFRFLKNETLFLKTSSTAIDPSVFLYSERSFKKFRSEWGLYL